MGWAILVTYIDLYKKNTQDSTTIYNYKVRNNDITAQLV